MRLRIDHRTVYRYADPVPYAIQTLRLSPRPYQGLAVLRWHVRADGRRELPSFIDGFGNLAHCHTINRRHDGVTLIAEGEVETQDTSGVVLGAPEPLPPVFFLRSTALTAPDPAIEALAMAAAPGRPPLERLHALMEGVGDRLAYKVGTTDAATTAADALQRGAGVCQDHAHLFIAAARLFGVPARYVGGYLWTGTDDREHEASHAWAEAFVDDLGWVGFDPSNRVCPTGAYIRASVGLDYWSAAPVRGIRRGDSNEMLSVRVIVEAGASDQ